MKKIIPTVGGILIIVTALICLFLVFSATLADPYAELFVGGLGILAFALGCMAGRMSMLRRHFWLAVTCGAFSLIPAFWVLLFTMVMLSTGSRFMYSIRFPIWLYLLVTALAPAVVGLVLVAASKKEFS